MIRSLGFILVCILLALLPLAFYYDGGLYLYSATKQALLAAAGLLLAALMFAERFFSARRLTPPDAAGWLVTVFVVWLGAAIAVAVNPWTAFMVWAQWAGAAAAFWFVRRSEHRAAALASLIIGALLTALIGYAQKAGWGPPMAADQYGELLATSTFGHANFAAQAVLPAVAAGVALLVTGTGAYAAAGALLLAAAAPYLAITGSRGAWLAALVSAAAVLAAALLQGAWGVRRRAVILAVAAALGLGALFTAVPGARERLANAFDTRAPSTAIRIAVWNDAYPIIFKHPLFGFGPGQFLYRFPDYWSEDTAKRVFAGGRHLVENPHNDWLALALDGGLPALGALAAALFLALVLPWRGTWRNQRPEPARAAAYAAVLAWAAYAWADYPLHNPVPLLGFFAALGLLAPLHVNDDPSRGKTNPAALPLLAAAVILTLWGAPRLLRSVPAQAEALQGQQYLALDPESAFRHALKAVNLDEHNALAFSLLGQAKLAMKPRTGERIDAEGAIFFLEKALSLYPDDFVSRYNLGVAVYEKATARNESFSRARQEFLRALAVNPYYGRAHYQLASIAAREELEWSAVKRHLDRGVKLDPPLLLHAAQAAEFGPYRATPEWQAWYAAMQRLFRVRTYR